MHRRWSTRYALAASLLALVVGCSGSPEKKLLQDFFRSSRLHDDITLGNFATATFDPRTDGVVESFEVESISEERTTPLPLKDYAKAVEDARADNVQFTQQKRTYQNENLAAIRRVLKAQADGKPVPSKDRAVKEAWEKWSADADTHTKALSDKQRQLSYARGIAELSLSRPNGATVDATKFDGVMVSKDVVINASVRDPKGQVSTRRLIATFQRPRMKDENGRDLIGRWIITSLKPA